MLFCELLISMLIQSFMSLSSSSLSYIDLDSSTSHALICFNLSLKSVSSMVGSCSWMHFLFRKSIHVRLMALSISFFNLTVHLSFLLILNSHIFFLSFTAYLTYTIIMSTFTLDAYFFFSSMICLFSFSGSTRKRQ